MTKEEFITERTRIISKMLDNPDDIGIYPTTKCFEQLDELFNKAVSSADHKTVLFAADYAYSLANLKDGEKKVVCFKEPPSMVYEQFERALKRWKEQKGNK